MLRVLQTNLEASNLLWGFQEHQKLYYTLIVNKGQILGLENDNSMLQFAHSPYLIPKERQVKSYITHTFTIVEREGTTLQSLDYFQIKENSINSKDPVLQSPVGTEWRKVILSNTEKKKEERGPLNLDQNQTNEPSKPQKTSVLCAKILSSSLGLDVLQSQLRERA